MKKLFILTLFFFSVSFAQIEKNIAVYRGDSTRIEFKANGNITTKGIVFVVKLTKAFSSPRLIQKKNLIAGGSAAEITATFSAPQTKVTVILGPDDTQDLTGATYYYDIVAADAGALTSYSTFNYGIFKVIQDVQTPFDGTDLPEDATRITTVSLPNGTLQNESIAWDTTLNQWVPAGFVFSNEQTIAIDSVSDALKSELLAQDDTSDFRAYSDAKYLSINTILVDTNIVEDLVEAGIQPVINDIENLNNDITRIDSIFNTKVDKDSIQSWEETAVLIGQIINDSVGYVKPETYGAVGDGVTDDRTAVYNALNTGTKVKLADGGTYYIGSSINIADKDINIEGNPDNPAKFIFDGLYQMKFTGSSGANTTLAQSTRVNDYYAVVTSTTNFDVGNLFTITTDSSSSYPYALGGGDYRMGEIHKIVWISGDTLFTQDKIWHSWNMDMVTVKGKVIKIQEYNPITVNISNVIFEYTTPQLVGGGLWIGIAENNVLENVSMIGAQSTGIMFDYCYNSKFNNGYVEGSNGTGLGYGVRFQCSSFNEVTNSSFFKNFKSIELSSSASGGDYSKFATRNTIVSNNFASGNGYMQNGVSTIYSNGGVFLHSHTPAENTMVSNNIVNNYSSFIAYDGSDLFAHNNKISGKAIFLFSFSDGNNYVLTNNVYESGIAFNDTIGSPNVYANLPSGFATFSAIDTSDNGYIRISNNYMNASKLLFINSGSNIIINNMIVKDNEVHFYNKDSVICKVYNGITFRNLVEHNNTFDSRTSGIQYTNNVSRDFIYNGDFISDNSWSPQSTWTIENGVAYCDATSTNPTTGAMVQASLMYTYPGDTFRVSFYVVDASASSRIGVYDPSSTYIYTDIDSGYYYSINIVATAIYTSLAIINGTLNEPFTIDKVSITRLEKNTETNIKSIYTTNDSYNIYGYKLKIQDMNVLFQSDTTSLRSGDVYVDSTNTLKVKY